MRSIWHSKGNEDGGNRAKSEADDAPLPFNGTISFEDISYTYVDGYLAKEKNENGETAYAYQNEYDRQGKCTGKYVSRKETRNKDGSMSEVEFLYAATANDIYLFKERERRKDPKDTPSYADAWDFERMTYHAPIGCGWYATTVYEDGDRVGKFAIPRRSRRKDKPIYHRPGQFRLWLSLFLLLRWRAGGIHAACRYGVSRQGRGVSLGTDEGDCVAEP